MGPNLWSIDSESDPVLRALFDNFMSSSPDYPKVGIIAPFYR